MRAWFLLPVGLLLALFLAAAALDAQQPGCSIQMQGDVPVKRCD